nr:hypothetical protein GCM10020092_055280 [Actinoplanes digitatis]
MGNPGRRIGVLLDASAQHSGRTGREVLTLAAMTMGIDRRGVEASLDRVGLNSTAAKRRVKAYSLGMRQRLGLAYAMLGDPGILILDEPANGLDPEGIFWMRGLLRDFADRGGTVLLSSHLLREVEAVADRLIVIGGGRVVAQGDKDELLAGTGTLVRALDRPALEAVLARAGLTGTATTDGGVVVQADAETIGRAAAGAGLVLLELRPAGSGGLEQMFLTLTARRLGEGGGPMTAVQQAPAGAVSVAPERDVDRTEIPLWRLVLVELRKLADTRSGLWLLIVIGLAAAGTAAIMLFAVPDAEQTFQGFLSFGLVPSERAAAGARHPVDDQRVVAADRADHVHPRAAARAGRRGEADRGRADRDRDNGGGGRAVRGLAT